MYDIRDSKYQHEVDALRQKNQHLQGENTQTTILLNQAHDREKQSANYISSMQQEHHHMLHPFKTMEQKQCTLLSENQHLHGEIEKYNYANYQQRLYIDHLRRFIDYQDYHLHMAYGEHMKNSEDTQHHHQQQSVLRKTICALLQNDGRCDRFWLMSSPSMVSQQIRRQH